MDNFQTTKDQTALAGLTKHDLTGAILQAGVQSYFAVNQAQDFVAQKQAGIITNPKMSFGTFSTNLKTDYRYGIAFIISGLLIIKGRSIYENIFIIIGISAIITMIAFRLIYLQIKGK